MVDSWTDIKGILAPDESVALNDSLFYAVYIGTDIQVQHNKLHTITKLHGTRGAWWAA